MIDHADVQTNRLLTDASTGIKGYINLKEQDKVSGQIRLDHKKRDLVLREGVFGTHMTRSRRHEIGVSGLVRDLVRSSPDPTVYSLIWKVRSLVYYIAGAQHNST